MESLSTRMMLAFVHHMRLRYPCSQNGQVSSCKDFSSVNAYYLLFDNKLINLFLFYYLVYLIFVQEGKERCNGRRSKSNILAEQGSQLLFFS